MEHYICSCLRKLSSTDIVQLSYMLHLFSYWVLTLVTQKLTCGSNSRCPRVWKKGKATLSIIQISQLHVNRDKVRCLTSRQIPVIVRLSSACKHSQLQLHSRFLTQRLQCQSAKSARPRAKGPSGLLWNVEFIINDCRLMKNATL